MKELEHLDFVRQQAETLTRTIKACAVRLSELRSQLEVPHDDQLRELEEITSRALDVWSAAVRQAEEDKQRLVNEVQDGLREIASIKEQLGDELMGNGAAAELRELQAPHHRTVRAWHNDVMGKQHYWRSLRDQRIEQYSVLQDKINSLRQQLGMSVNASGGAPDVSKANMEFLQLEFDKLQAEQGRRQERLWSMLQHLSAKAAELGEDGKQAAARAHPSLADIGDLDSQHVLQQVYSCTGDASSAGPDLSDATFAALSSKLKDMEALKAQREAHAAEIMGVLSSLWDAMAIPASSTERQVFVRMMTGELRLHGKSLEKCMAEVRRLEAAKVAQMVQLVRDKAAELVRMCQEAHVEPPSGLDACLEQMDSADRCPGAAADLLSRLVRMLAEVQVLTAKRAAILDLVKGVEHARKEQVWLRSFEADAQRYKGRDASRNLQRAIEAGKLRDGMAAKISKVAAALEEWQQAEGAPFLYDGINYQAEVLPLLETEQQQVAAEKAARGTARRQTGVPASASKGRPPSAVGNRTPMPKQMDRALQERHSIAVVRDDPNWSYGPSALNRSTTHLPAAALATPVHRPSTASKPSSGKPSRLLSTPTAQRTSTSSSSRGGGSCSGSESGSGGGYSTPPAAVMAHSRPITPGSGSGAGAAAGQREAPAAASVGAARGTVGTRKVLTDILQQQALHDVAKLYRSSPGAASAATPEAHQRQVLDVEQEAREEQFKQLMGKQASPAARKDQDVSPTKKAMKARA